MNYSEIARLLQEFERYDKNNYQPSTSKLERCYDYITKKIRVLDALAQIINHRTGKQVNETLITSLDEETVKYLDKTVRYYFKLERSSSAPAC